MPDAPLSLQFANNSITQLDRAKAAAILGIKPKSVSDKWWALRKKLFPAEESATNVDGASDDGSLKTPKTPKTPGSNKRKQTSAKVDEEDFSPKRKKGNAKTKLTPKNEGTSDPLAVVKVKEDED